MHDQEYGNDDQTTLDIKVGPCEQNQDLLLKGCLRTECQGAIKKNVGFGEDQYQNIPWETPEKEPICPSSPVSPQGIQEARASEHFLKQIGILLDLMKKGLGKGKDSALSEFVEEVILPLCKRQQTLDTNVMALRPDTALPEDVYVSPSDDLSPTLYAAFLAERVRDSLSSLEKLIACVEAVQKEGVSESLLYRVEACRASMSDKRQDYYEDLFCMVFPCYRMTFVELKSSLMHSKADQEWWQEHTSELFSEDWLKRVSEETFVRGIGITYLFCYTFRLLSSGTVDKRNVGMLRNSLILVMDFAPQNDWLTVLHPLMKDERSLQCGQDLFDAVSIKSKNKIGAMQGEMREMKCTMNKVKHMELKIAKLEKERMECNCCAREGAFKSHAKRRLLGGAAFGSSTPTNRSTIDSPSISKHDNEVSYSASNAVSVATLDAFCEAKSFLKKWEKVFNLTLTKALSHNPPEVTFARNAKLYVTTRYNNPGCDVNLKTICKAACKLLTLSLC